jgi:DNA-binding NarL/FixJ family response regulator
MTRIYVVNHRPLIVEGLRSLFSAEKDVVLVGAAASGRSCLASFVQDTADVVLLNSSLPDMSSLELCSVLKSRHPGVMILGWSAYNEVCDITGLLESGASGCIAETAGKDELLQAISVVNAGKTYFSEVSRQLLRQDHPPLTPREKQVLSLLTEGYTSKEIAGALFIGTTTVHSHRKNLLTKLQVRNTAMLIKLAMERRLLG